MPPPYRIGLVGLGKIAQTQHVPAIDRSPDFELVAVAERNAVPVGLPRFASIEALIAEGPPVDAVAICTPPRGRHLLAATAIDAGLAVMLEKPPGATLTEVSFLRARAAAAGTTLFTAWHSREAPGVRPAADWLRGRRVNGIRIDWREDIRRWHPGQDWILDAGGFGVFDPAINAFSILTKILPDTFIVSRAVLEVPGDRQAPIAADLELTSDGGAAVAITLDFLKTGEQCWEIAVETDGGVLQLRDGGARLVIDGRDIPLDASDEYGRLYAEFARLIARGTSDVDATPLQIVEDALTVAERRQVDPFAF